MKILHILNDGHTSLSDQIISAQSKDNEVKVIDLSKKQHRMKALWMIFFA